MVLIIQKKVKRSSNKKSKRPIVKKRKKADPKGLNPSSWLPVQRQKTVRERVPISVWRDKDRTEITYGYRTVSRDGQKYSHIKTSNGTRRAHGFVNYKPPIAHRKTRQQGVLCRGHSSGINIVRQTRKTLETLANQMNGKYTQKSSRSRPRAVVSKEVLGLLYGYTPRQKRDRKVLYKALFSYGQNGPAYAEALSAIVYGQETQGKSHQSNVSMKAYCGPKKVVASRRNLSSLDTVVGQKILSRALREACKSNIVRNDLQANLTAYFRSNRYQSYQRAKRYSA